MSSNDAAIEVALLEIAKDLLQASDDLAATDPSASAKLAQEAYEIGRDLGVVLTNLEETLDDAEEMASDDVLSLDYAQSNGTYQTGQPARIVEEDGDDELFRILDRQRAVVPDFAEPVPVQKPSRRPEPVAFEVSATPRRSKWFSWVRSRDLSHVG